ncbi:MAG: hypothetical protein R3C03_22090 [Pirellulaceae bacterium]
MNTALTCPSCKAKIEITEVMRSQLTTEIRDELEADIRAKRRDLEGELKDLHERRQKIDLLETQIDTRIRDGIDAEKENSR